MLTFRALPVIRWLSWSLCIALTAMACVPGETEAVPMPPGAVSAPPVGGRPEDLGKVQRVLEQEPVRQRLRDLGLTEAEIAGRLSRLDDAELRELAGRLSEVGAGGQAVQCQGGADCIAVLAVWTAVILAVLIVYGVVSVVKWAWSKLTAPRPSTPRSQAMGRVSSVPFPAGQLAR